MIRAFSQTQNTGKGMKLTPTIRLNVNLELLSYVINCYFVTKVNQEGKMDR